jgi:hypothetical protein
MRNRIYHDTLALAVASLSNIEPAPGENLLTARARVKRAVLSQIEVIREVASSGNDEDLLAACDRAREAIGAGRKHGPDGPEAAPAAE